jgi:predicted AlkP superfamily phosphohydrolase/phosphomutase
MKSRVMLLGLDGFEPTFAAPLMAAGRLPALRRLRDAGYSVVLEHGAARRSGRAWEHFSTGLDPDAAECWTAVDFDPTSYRVVQRLTRQPAFPDRLGVRTTIFDAPYFDLAGAPGVTGIVGWGAHDPGVLPTARPTGLAQELSQRFGEYAAEPWIYGFIWPDADRAEIMGRDLARAVEQRFAAAEWLFAERLPDWQLGVLVAGEFHSAAEAMWHGVDPTHPLANLPSAEPARKGMKAVYEAADRCIGQLIERLPDTVFVAFSFHGMGPNDADVASMALLSELLYRHSFGRPLMQQRSWRLDDRGVPLLDRGEQWERAVNDQLGLRSRLAHLASRVRTRLRPDPTALSLGWMPAARYRPFWPRMRAFAIPSFYDGRIRINLQGRERHGLVPIGQHSALIEELEALLRECRDPVTGREMVAGFERSSRPPMELKPSESDLTVLWKDAPLGFSHPRLGKAGPLPYRRTGGHTGGDGFAWVSGPGIEAGDGGTRSAFDLAPTVIELLGERPLPISGRSFASSIEPAPPQPALVDSE